jgi:transcription initiation factor TFIID TATA-box-binding protein
MAELVSVVGGGDFEIQLDLASISQELNADSITYEPEVFAGLYFKLSESGPTTMVFSNGKFNITGARDIEHLQDVHNKVVSELEAVIESNIPEHELHIRNLVYKEEYGRELALSQVAVGLGAEVTEYEPEQHPSLIYSSDDFDSGVLLIFNSGAIIATGFRKEEEAKIAINEVMGKLDTLFQETN